MTMFLTLLIFRRHRLISKIIFIFCPHFIGMNRNNIQSKNNSSTNLVNKNLQVQKVINQRIMNGIKQFKVIWIGKTFQEASWITQDKLNCPDKINQFLKRYQQVMRRKSQQAQNQNPTPIQNQQIIQKNQHVSTPNIKKISLEKPVNGTQSKIVLSQSTSLNKQKLQASLSKSCINDQNKPQRVETLKQIPKTIKIGSDNKKKGAQKTTASSDFLNSQVSKNSNIKSDKSQENQSEAVNQLQIKQKKVSSPKSSGNNEKSNIEQEDTASQSQISQCSQIDQIKITQRLEIEKIYGIASLNSTIDEFKRKLLPSKDDGFELENSIIANYFLVKNKFSSDDKLVSRQRIINQQPQRLIEYYESLLMNSQQKKL